MGLFGNKEECPICGLPAKGMFNIKIKNNLTLCKGCSKKISMEKSMQQFQSVEDINEHLAYREENCHLFKKFSPTNEVLCGIFCFREDSQMGKWYYSVEKKPENPELFGYDEIIDYEFTENGEQVLKGGLGAAATGGILLGGVGAIVGSNVGKKRSRTIVTSMQVRISLSNKYRNQILIELLPLNSELKAGSAQYNTYKLQADKLVSFLDGLCSKANISQSALNQPPKSEADEILKYKNLLDAGAITQEEFEAKKKQLLGL